jgi:putative DNA primase/helicase
VRTLFILVSLTLPKLALWVGTALNIFVQAHSSQTTTDLTSPKRLNDKHFAHCCGSDLQKKQRGLNPDWVAANCHSVDIKEATQLLCYPARSGGILIKGANGQYQFRPDQPWSDKQGKKAPKYRTAAGDEYDALLPAHPTDSHYWLNLEALKELCYKVYETVYSYTDSEGREILVENPSHPLAQPKVLEIPCLLITEGGFKAICACSEGIPTLALLGVEMGLTSAKSDPQGKRYLVPSLETLAKAGFGFILAFDTDISTKLDVRKALHKLGCQLTKFNSPVYVLPEWDEQLGKGIDDYIQMNNIDKFRELLAKSVSFETWVENQRSEGEEPKLSPVQRAWLVVLKEYAHRLRFNRNVGRSPHL